MLEFLAGIGEALSVTGGTLYLEDLPGLAPDLQSRLLKNLTGPGGTQGSPIGNIRILASSTVDPERLVEQGRLVEEAFVLWGANILELPPLRDP